MDAQGLVRPARRPAGRARRLAVFVVAILHALSAVLLGQSAPSVGASPRCCVVELYLRGKDAASNEIAAALAEFAAGRTGVLLRTYDLDQPGGHVDRFEKILKHYRVANAQVPAVYTCNSLLLRLGDAAAVKRQVEAALTVNVFVRKGCPRCDAAKAFLKKVEPRYPGFRFVQHDVVEDAAALRLFQQTAERYRQAATSLPAFHYCNELSVGFLGENSTGKQLESKLRYWSIACSPPQREAGAPGAAASRQHSGPGASGVPAPARREGRSAALTAALPPLLVLEMLADAADDAPADTPPPPPSGDTAAPLPGSEGRGDLPADAPDPDEGFPPAEAPPLPPAPGEQAIEVPVFGELRLNRLGMPVLTLVVGLVDGFNPCAMWVLLFLLSILVNLRSRPKILAVAGTFVVISGLAYFAFMAAWLNVLLLVPHLDSLQLAFGLLAVFIGSVHVKDFFAFKRGVSLSIPETAKPGIYARVRRIVTAENLAGAIVGAGVLAVLVNLIELLCTAGLPAVYSNILALQDYPAWKNYAYLGLYNLAYMFDDLLMVSLVVVTLGKHKLQERHGRWLKLISGSAICALGLVMIFRPQWLT